MIIGRKLVEAGTIHYCRKAGGTRPDLRIVDSTGQRIIVKDFAGSDYLFRVLISPILIRRECGALLKLKGVNGVPQLLGRLDRYALEIEHLEGISLELIEPGMLKSEFYEKLRKVVDDIHRRGVAHCDLRSKGNVLLGLDGNPHIVDFAACAFKGWGINPFINWVFRLFVNADNNAVLRIKRRLSPELLTEQDKAELEIPLPFEKTAKQIGCFVRDMTRRLLTR